MSRARLPASFQRSARRARLAHRKKKTLASDCWRRLHFCPPPPSQEPPRLEGRGKGLLAAWRRAPQQSGTALCPRLAIAAGRASTTATGQARRARPLCRASCCSVSPLRAPLLERGAPCASCWRAPSGTCPARLPRRPPRASDWTFLWCSTQRCAASPPPLSFRTPVLLACARASCPSPARPCRLPSPCAACSPWGNCPRPLPLPARCQSGPWRPSPCGSKRASTPHPRGLPTLPLRACPSPPASASTSRSRAPTEALPPS